MYIYMKFPLEDLNPNPCPHTPQSLILLISSQLLRTKKILIWEMNYAILNIGSTVAKFKNRNR